MYGKSVLSWWLQRITALIMLPFPILFVMALFAPNLEEGLLELTRGYKGLFSVLFILPALYHGFLGIQVVLEDYVSSDVLRAFLITFLKIFTSITAGAVLVVVLMQMLGVK
ncbi:succinate dehydrogenase, hydrophobic membrane anchor protein [Candidatus Anaplasma sp. TIGMIC]|uniref:succinate dehydrogenase, hydrophobic membrane anchor protein n=1 Tax=Candidatus Anaplasma sp. TIGMIC TaxID=3020713 RepID=UPI00232CC0BE|nr:succinate dehydrogenase, hydrophobic membrane anchor protein [Candidatus Anaplasma sp. TIGMIC]MDB1135029.1 succinate dehydrogenase, hydrophobic membrane anchor protein [Candidatus Anaplasma sp. TIGMIC]